VDVIVALGEFSSALVGFLLRFVRFSQISVVSCPISYLTNFLPLETSSMLKISCQGPVLLIYVTIE